jgi:hypothetical protein
MTAGTKRSLLWKILASTSIAITLLLALAGWFVQDRTQSVLEPVSLVLSTMSDVRAAFQTNDRATIRDTAAEIWSRVSQSGALFLVTDPRGEVIASLGGGQRRLRVLRSVLRARDEEGWHHYYLQRSARLTKSFLQ